MTYDGQSSMWLAWTCSPRPALETSCEKVSRARRAPTYALAEITPTPPEAGMSSVYDSSIPTSSFVVRLSTRISIFLSTEPFGVRTVVFG
ncbi:hypothetical protein BC938DRAFT_473585 [Jimgerdemannia flammicorona]|uniref:Uncharacterized protein n=1 Tax=Jimgerdemannia flammicorona TaxID=994334 RepID=A0A433QT83_9FUNG|nr:hypothetical protein BC938DRAFT_473585 [Jimgerdemannia flammicorona]